MRRFYIMWCQDKFNIFRGIVYHFGKQFFVFGPGASRHKTQLPVLECFHEFKRIIPVQDLFYPVQAGIAAHGHPVYTYSVKQVTRVFILYKKVTERLEGTSHKSAVGFKEQLVFTENGRDKNS